MKKRRIQKRVNNYLEWIEKNPMDAYIEPNMMHHEEVIISILQELIHELKDCEISIASGCILIRWPIDYDTTDETGLITFTNLVPYLLHWIQSKGIEIKVLLFKHILHVCNIIYYSQMINKSINSDVWQSTLEYYKEETSLSEKEAIKIIRDIKIRGYFNKDIQEHFYMTSRSVFNISNLTWECEEKERWN